MRHILVESDTPSLALNIIFKISFNFKGPARITDISRLKYFSSFKMSFLNEFELFLVTS